MYWLLLLLCGTPSSLASSLVRAFLTYYFKPDTTLLLFIFYASLIASLRSAFTECLLVAVAPFHNIIFCCPRQKRAVLQQFSAYTIVFARVFDLRRFFFLSLNLLLTTLRAHTCTFSRRDLLRRTRNKKGA